VTVGNTTTYTWSCNASTATPCSADYTTTPPVTGSFDLSIKKYAKSEDVFASVDNTEEFNYTIVVRNNGTGAVTGTTTVRDTLPVPITLRATPSGNGWTCTGAVGTRDITCTTTDTYAANTEFNVITVPVRVENLVFRPAGYMNYAYVQNPQEAV
jgi:large repetitive protein